MEYTAGTRVKIRQPIYLDGTDRCIPSGTEGVIGDRYRNDKGAIYVEFPRLSRGIYLYPSELQLVE